MSMEDDEILHSYVEESLEHLANIENDLLAIEKAGADIDEDLVNSAFRAAHSIKGGAGFLGLNNIKNLAHKIENVMGLIRNREIAPNPEIINILLLAFDKLRDLISNVGQSDEIDISEHTVALTELTTASLTPEARQSVSKMVDICLPDGKSVFTLPEFDISRARKGGKFIYLIEYDFIHDVHRKGKTPLDILKEMQKSGIILESKVDISAVGLLEDDPPANSLPFLVLFASIIEPDMVDGLINIDESRIHTLREGMVVADTGKAEPAEGTEPARGLVKKAEPDPKSQQEEPVPGLEIKPSQPETSLRVHVSLLDSLMTLAGELVLSRNQLLQGISSRDEHSLEVAGQRIDLITSELQEAIMLTRMQPIEKIFSKFPRVVRDLARDLGKEIELTVEGKEVELDKTIIEGLGDPLTHLVRNAVDHGIETPDVRRKAGKQPAGQILLRAYHEAGQVNIEITDDGRGLDGDKLASSAIAKGLITKEQAGMMSAKEKITLIFLPGFSTAEKVTDVSGRGVGMDVVKTNLDRLGGVIDIDSQPGEGTTIRIKLPLTLAIIPSQIVSVGVQRYAIPQVNLDELLRISASEVKDRIEVVGDAEVVRLRGRLLPLIRLAEVLGIERTYIDPEDAEEKPDRRKNIADRRSRKSPVSVDSGQWTVNSDEERETSDAKSSMSESQEATDHSQSAIPGPDLTYGGSSPLQSRRARAGRNPNDRRYHASSAVNIAVVYAGAVGYGVVVDALHDSQETVVKPLGRHLKHCEGYAGATIMGDGHVVLILDVAGLARMAQLTSVEGTDRAAEVAGEAREVMKDRQALLVFRNAEDEQFAAPLGLVERVEKIKVADIEQVGGKRVVQYRGASLPLFAIEEVANVKPLADKEELAVIVFKITDREVGLLATPPVDAVEVSIQIDDSTLKQPGIMGSAIIGDYTTLFVDLFGFMETLNPDWFEKRQPIQVSSNGKAATILLVEDSDFFRNHVRGFIEDDGYNVIEAEDGVVAWNLLQAHTDEIAMIVTDIEMPNLDGLGLTEKIRGDERFSHLPVIALTCLAGDKDVVRGKAVGIDDYQIKLDKEKLMESVYNYLKKGR